MRVTDLDWLVGPRYLVGVRHAWLLLMVTGCLVGCVTAAQQTDAARVRMLNPQPLVAKRPGLEVALAIDSAIPDAFTIPEQNGITSVPVESWRTSLSNAFKNSFGTSQSPTVVVHLTAARLDYVPDAQSVHNGQIITHSVRARIRFAVAFTDAKENQLDAIAGEVLSMQPWLEMGGSSSTAAEAIEAMYRQIAERLGRVPLEAAPSRASAPPT